MREATHSRRARESFRLPRREDMRERRRNPRTEEEDEGGRGKEIARREEACACVNYTQLLEG